MKTIKANLVNLNMLEAVSKNMATIEDATKSIEIDIPDYVIGVGVVGVIDDYLKENNLTGWEAASYTVIKK